MKWFFGLLFFTIIPIYLLIGFLHMVFRWFKDPVSHGIFHAANYNTWAYLFNGIVLWPLNLGKTYPNTGIFIGFDQSNPQEHEIFSNLGGKIKGVLTL